MQSAAKLALSLGLRFGILYNVGQRRPHFSRKIEHNEGGQKLAALRKLYNRKGI